MGLTITRMSGAHEGKRDDMATTAEIRVYRTTDGELVGEGDPRGAFLAYPAGSEVDESDVRAYRALRDSRSLGTRAQVDEGARDFARQRQAGDPTKQPGPGEAPALVHDRLATELADEARMLANVDPEAVASVRAELHGRPVATARLARTTDGRLVPETDRDAAILAYTPGMEIQDHDLDAFAKLNDGDDGEPSEPAETPETPEGDGSGPDSGEKSATAPPDKSAQRPADKAATTRRTTGTR